MTTQTHRNVIAQAIAELDAEHRPMWLTDGAESMGDPPSACDICWPGDNKWPCVTRMIADDLRQHLAEMNDKEESDV